MRNEYIVALAWVTAQLTVTSIAVALTQESVNKNLEEGKKISYWRAYAIYLNKETGQKVIAFCGLLSMLFLFPDFWNADINVMDLRLKPVKTWKENIMIYQRVTAYLVGGLIDLILILAFKKGAKAVERFADKIA